MGISKKINFGNIFIFLFLVVFPLGQIVRIGIIQPIDVIVGIAMIYSILKKLPEPPGFKYFRNFLIIVGFSWIFGSLIFWQKEVLYGLLYLIRLTAYLYFLVYIWNFAKKSYANKKLLIDSLLAVSVFAAIFGWVQFFWISDLKPFFVWGWDIHLFRLVGTFLDPTFLGLIIVFGLLITIYRYIEQKNIGYLIITAFLGASLAFTYSRASYLAFFAGLLVVLYYYKKLKIFLLIAVSFFAIMLLLPTSQNHVLSFTREFSAFARIENYQTTLKIFTKSPVAGVGYDNMCIAYQNFIGPQSFASHACSGSDSSLLFILATTGIIGSIVFIYSIWNISRSLSGPDLLLIGSSFFALLIHSLFSNSMFYPWIMGWMVVLLAVSLRGKI